MVRYDAIAGLAENRVARKPGTAVSGHRPDLLSPQRHSNSNAPRQPIPPPPPPPPPNTNLSVRKGNAQDPRPHERNEQVHERPAIGAEVLSRVAPPSAPSPSALDQLLVVTDVVGGYQGKSICSRGAPQSFCSRRKNEMNQSSAAVGFLHQKQQQHQHQQQKFPNNARPAGVP